MQADQTATVSAGEAIVKRVSEHGIETIFGIPGAQIYPLFDGIDRYGIKLVVPRHEQAAGYMAMGYAKSTGRIGVCSVVPGPGVLNASAALCTAMGNCSPVLCLTGEVPSQYMGRGRGHLHELKNQKETLKSIIKNAIHIADIKDIISSVDRAMSETLADRPGPVALQMSWDKMLDAVPIATPAPNAAPPRPVTFDQAQVIAAAKLIAAARRPMIMCGAGAQHASEAVTALAEILNAPVTAFRSGRGVVADDHQLAAPPVAARELWEQTDLLIGIGSRLEMPYMRWRSPFEYVPQPPGPKLVRIDIDADEMGRLIPDAPVVGDAAEVCRALVDELPRHLSSDRIDQRDDIAQARALANRLLQRMQPQMDYLAAIRGILPRDGFVVPELSQMGFATYTDAFAVLEPRTYVTEGHQGTLGFGFPTALGVKVANPDRAVISITGDGGFMFGVQELATAAEYDIGAVTLLFNNASYANVMRDQQTRSGRVVGSTFKNPDFLKLAEAFGVDADRVVTPRELESRLERALASGKPHLIEIVVDTGSESTPWPFIHMTQKPSDME